MRRIQKGWRGQGYSLVSRDNAPVSSLHRHLSSTRERLNLKEVGWGGMRVPQPIIRVLDDGGTLTIRPDPTPRSQDSVLPRGGWVDAAVLSRPLQGLKYSA